MERTFIATIEKRDKWYIGWVDEVPGAFSQGKTIKEVQEDLKEAVHLIIESQRDLIPRETTNFLNPIKARTATVPRHREIDEDLARKICRQLDIDPPKG